MRDMSHSGASVGKKRKGSVCCVNHNMNSTSQTAEVTGYCRMNDSVNDWRAEISLAAKAPDHMNLEHVQRAGCMCNS